MQNTVATRTVRVTRATQRVERNNKILADYNAGMTYPELSEKYGLSQRRIYEILAKFPKR